MKVFTIAGILMAAMLANCINVSVAVAATRKTTAQTAIERVTNQWQEDKGLIGLSASCVSGAQTVSAASGQADASRDMRLDADYRFQIGSVTKTFTAAAIMTLVADGQINLEDTLAGWYPDFPNADAVTLRALLDMTAGTFDFFRASPENPMIPLIMEDIRHPWTPDEVIAMAANQPAQGEPGTLFWYSNTNYFLLGRIVEKVSGMNLGVFFEDRLFASAGLSKTRLSRTDETAFLFASGYLRDSAFLFGHDAPFSLQQGDYAGLETLGWAAGGMTATSADLARWGQALFSGQIVDKPQLKDMITPTALANEGDQRYGLGVETFDTEVGTAYGHAGSLPGYAAILMFFPDQQASIAVTTNDEAGEQFLQSVAIDIAQNACAE